MARTVRYSLPLKYEGARNARDLGGYPTKYGTNTALGQYIRCDNPSKFSAKDLCDLYDYGVRFQVDFRSPSETDAEPSKLKGYRDIEYINPIMLDNLNSNDAHSIAALPPSLGEMYIGFVDGKKDVYAKVLRDCIRHMDNCIFFNCSAGKDRTGTFAMILLKLAGVPDDVIVTDYVPSGDNIWADTKPQYEAYKAKGVDILHLMQSNAVEMERLLAHMNNNYGSIENWMTLCGLTENEIVALRNKMLGQY
jgi:Protein tyrosine/serine phosphatase